MNAQQDRLFSERADAVGRALWPGQVKIAGTVYPCSLVPTQVEISADDTPAGVRTVAAVRVEISKSQMAAAPAFDTMLEDLATGRLHRVKIVDGAHPNDSSWLLTCTQKSA